MNTSEVLMCLCARFVLGNNQRRRGGYTTAIIQSSVFIAAIKTAFSSIVVPRFSELLLNIYFVNPGLDDQIPIQHRKTTAALAFEILSILLSPIIATIILDGNRRSLINL